LAGELTAGYFIVILSEPINPGLSKYALKVSGNWRVFFQFIDGDAYIVDYDDYH
jgi:hypothetical protein